MSNEQLAIINEKHGPEVFSKEFSEEYLTKICGNWGGQLNFYLEQQNSRYW